MGTSPVQEEYSADHTSQLHLDALLVDPITVRDTRVCVHERRLGKFETRQVSHFDGVQIEPLSG